MSILPAARKGDEVSHSYAAAMTTIAAPFAIGGGIVVGILLAETGPLAISAGLNTAMLVLQLAEWAGSQSRQTTGKISHGASSVFVGEARRRHARIEDPVECQDNSLAPMLAAILATQIGPKAYALLEYSDTLGDKHDGAFLKHGSDCVLIEMAYAARVGDKVDCEAQVEKGEASVLEGGEVVALAGTTDGSEVPAVIQLTYWAMDWADAFVSLYSAKTALKHLKPDATKFDIFMKKTAVKTAKTGIALKASRDALNVTGNKDEAIVPDAVDKVIKTTELLVNTPKGLKTKPKDTIIKISTQTRKDVTTAQKIVKPKKPR